jgi:tetratricopeptide (TPR) repeat protein
MSFFKKLFGSGKHSDPSAPTPPPLQKPPAKSADSSTSEGEPIKAFDKFGRELLISRRDWIDGVLIGQIKKEWNNPDALAGILIQSFNDGIFTEVEEAAKQLRTIDPNPSRGATLLGIVYLQTARPAEAERVFSAYLKQHGEDGVVLTNLAKAQAAQGRDGEAEQTLWHALELDPSQDNGLGWYEVMHREKGGPAAGVEALKRIAALPGSWRARLWLARAALEARDLDAALSLYQESLHLAGSPVPTDLLMQMSGDLGNHGHIPEILDLAGPHFDVEIHGITVGNNLIKASIDTGHLDSALEIIRKLEACQRPDWRENLGFWESELQKARLQTQAPVPAEKVSMTMLQLTGPLWLMADHGTSRSVPPRAPDAPHIVFLGSSFESARIPSEMMAQPSDGPGRMSRALPLFLNETVHLHSDARTTTLVPWITNGGGGFGLFGRAPDLAEMAHQARQWTAGADGAQAADFLVGTHLVTCGENWKLQVSLVRSIDGKTLSSHSYDFAEADFRRIADRVTADLLADLSTEAGIASRTPPAATQVQAAELDHYLFRLEQTLAVRCGTMEGTERGFLSNPAEILDGMLYLCLQNPAHLPSRILLWRVLDGLKKREPELVKSMGAKVKELQAGHPLPPEFQVLLDQELNTILVA